MLLGLLRSQLRCGSGRLAKLTYRLERSDQRSKKRTNQAPMIGPQRLSLLEGDVLRRPYPARSAVDRVLDRLVDAFDLKLGVTSDASVGRRLSFEKSSLPKRIGEAYALIKDSHPPSMPSSSRSWRLGKQSLGELINEKLCMWFLNASPREEKQNPMELGWSATGITRERPHRTDDDLLLYSFDEDELPLECNYTSMN